MKPAIRIFAMPFQSISRVAPALLAASLLLLLCACSSADAPLVLPDSVAAWKRSGDAPIAAEAIPESLRPLNVRSGQRAIYQQAEASVQAAVYYMPSATSAFEAVQTYARQADEYYFHKGSSFVVVNLKELSMDSRRSFLLAFQAATTPDGPEKSKD